MNDRHELDSMIAVMRAFNHAHVYQMPDGVWACAVCGVIAEPFESEDAALKWAWQRCKEEFMQPKAGGIKGGAGG